MARARLVAGARRRRGGDVPVEPGAAGGGRATEQYEISNVARPGRESRAQPEILAGRRVARVRLRRALDARRRAVEERRRAPTSTSRAIGAGDAGRQRAPASSPATSGWRMRCSPACAWPTGSTSRPSGQRYGVDVWGRFGAGARSRSSTTGLLLREGPAAPADPRRDAPGQRNHGGFRLASDVRVGISTACTVDSPLPFATLCCSRRRLNASLLRDYDWCPGAGARCRPRSLPRPRRPRAASGAAAPGRAGRRAGAARRRRRSVGFTHDRPGCCSCRSSPTRPPCSRR